MPLISDNLDIMKQYVFFLVFFSFGLFVFGQKSSDEGESLLLEVSEKLKSYKNIYIEFSHTFANESADIRQETSGNVTLEGNKYHLNYMGTEQIFDGENLNMIVHEDEEIIVQKETEEDNGLITPSKMFTFYEKGFSYKMDVADRLDGLTIQYVELIPKDRNSEIMNVKVGVDIDSKHIYNVIETGKNGTMTEMTVTNFKYDQRVLPSLFKLDKAMYQQKNYMISWVE